MSMSPIEIAAWSVVLPGTLGLAAGLASRLINPEQPTRWSRALRMGLPPIAVLLGYLAGEIVHRGVPKVSPVQLGWPLLNEDLTSATQWWLWIVVVAAVLPLIELALPSRAVFKYAARWSARALALGFMYATVLESVRARGEFDDTTIAFAWIGGSFALAFTAMGLTDLAFRHCGGRLGGVALVATGTVASIALFQAGLQPETLGGLIAALGGLMIAGGPTATRFAGPLATLVITTLTATAITGHFHVYPEFDAWVWGVILLMPASVIIARLPQIARVLIVLAIIAGAVVVTVGLPEVPGSGGGGGGSGSGGYDYSF